MEKRAARARRCARGRRSRGGPETKARRPLVDDAGAWSPPWPGPVERALGGRCASSAGPAPAPAPAPAPGRGDPARLSAPAAPLRSPAQQPLAAPAAARGPPGPREGRDDPCWPEQWRLPSPAPPRRSALCPPGLGAPREFVGDLEEQPECEALPGCGNQASVLSALPLLGTRRPHSGRPPSRGASPRPRPRLLKPVPPEGAWHRRRATGLR